MSNKTPVPEKEIPITITVSKTVYALLQTLCDADQTIDSVVEDLVDHAQQGVYRPGAWEREWLIQAFGDDFTEKLEPGDPYGRVGMDSVFERPKDQRVNKAHRRRMAAKVP